MHGVGVEQVAGAFSTGYSGGLLDHNSAPWLYFLRKCSQSFLTLGNLKENEALSKVNHIKHLVYTSRMFPLGRERVE
jgi:hypothetical protein